MSADGSLFFDEHYGRIQQMIDAALSAYKPDLTLATGELSSTRYPTPTGNAPGGYTPATHTHPWSDISSTPTTLAGYGITDAQPIDSDLTAIAALSTTSYGRGFLAQADAAAARTYIGVGTGAGTVTSVDITAPAAGITATGGPITSSGSITLALADDLAALEALSSTGLAARTAADTWAQRTITGTSARIAVTNGNGVSGNPTIDIDSGYVGQASITTLGTIGTGVWQGTKVAEAYGGTNQSTYTRGDLLYASAANTLSKLTIGASARYLRSDGTDPSWHTLDAADLTYSGLTAGQVLRATGASAAAFGQLDLANSSAITGIVPAANGGTGVNNSTRTLTINTNAGTLAFSSASSTLTIPATGTAALLGTAQTFSADQTIAANLIFSGTGRRITGDMTSATFADRVAFQSSTTNGTTAISVLPNGTATTASIVIFNGSDPDNAARLAMNATSTAIQFSTNASGSGTQQKMSFLLAGSQLVEYDTGPNIGLCTAGGSYGSGVRVIFIGNRTTAPTSNPTGGGILYAAAGAGTWRGSSGTITGFGPAGPHCEVCGYDAWTVAMRNDIWKAYCYICGRCGARYMAGPQNVLGLLGPEERAQIIRQGMSYEEVHAILE